MNKHIKTIVTNLLEEFGVYNIFNKKYHNKIKNISSEIISKLSYISKQSEIDYKSSLITKDEIYYTNVYHYDLNLDWLKTLNIYLGLGKFSITNEDTIYTLTEPLICIITDTGQYKVVNNNFVYEKINYYIIQEYDNKPNEKIIPYIVDYKNNIIEKASIIISIPIKQISLFNIDKLISIIKHELGHLYDLFKQNINTEQLNKDIIYSSIFNSNNMPYYNKAHEYFYNKLYKLNNKDRQKLIKNDLNHYTIAYFLKNNIEIFNISELHQYLHNFKYEIDKMDDETLLIDFIDKHSKHEKYLYKISNIFKQRYDTCQILKMFIDYLPITVKINFTILYIKNGIGQKTENGFIFNKNLKVNGEYSYKSFDKFINILIERIQNIFIRNALLIFDNKIHNINYLNKTKLKFEPFKGLTKQNNSEK